MPKQMTGLERVMAVLNLQEPDRVPTFEWEIHLVDAMTGGSYEDFIVKYDHDAVVGKPDYRLTQLDNEHYRDEWGVTRAATHALDEYAPVQSMTDVETLVLPDPWAEHRFETLQALIDRFKGERAIIVNMRDVWSNPRDLMGYVNLFLNCKLNPEMVEALVIRCVDHSIELARHAAELGADLVMFNDDIADNRRTLISLEMWDDYFQPHFERLIKAVHECGLFVWKHTDGNIMTILDRFIAAGIDGIDPIDPIAKMDLATVKECWGDQVAIKGNVDQAYLLMTGDEAEVVEAVKNCIRVAGPGGGYVCSTSNIPHAGVKPHLYEAMIAAIQEYGVYPLDMEKLAPPE